MGGAGGQGVGIDRQRLVGHAALMLGRVAHIDHIGGTGLVAGKDIGGIGQGKTLAGQAAAKLQEIAGGGAYGQGIDRTGRSRADNGGNRAVGGVDRAGAAVDTFGFRTVVESCGHNNLLGFGFDIGIERLALLP